MTVHQPDGSGDYVPMTELPNLTHGIPTGGTSTQVLAKASGTDYDAHWVDDTDTDSDTAAGTSYDHTSSGLTATTVQAALDEIVVDSAAPTGDVTYLANKGPVVHDTTDGHTYRVVSTNGVLALVQVT